MMKANRKRTTKPRPWAVVICVLAASAVLGGVLMPAWAATEGSVPPSEAESLGVIRQNAPAVARAIAADKELRSVVGGGKWPLALHRLAEFTKKTDADHQDALRIIGDTVTRAKSPVGTIKLDGDSSDWSESMPGVEFVRPPKGPTADLWKSGAAALVRQDRLYLMAGLADTAKYFAQPGNELRVTIDCHGDQAWDVGLSISMHKGSWIIKQKPIGFKGLKIKALPAPQAAVGTVAEIAIAIRDFVSLTEAKPIWTLQMEALGRTGKDRQGKPAYLGTSEFSLFNENAREGVAAWPYVRTFLCLCADKPLDDFELTAAAIAIMSSSMYNGSDENVRKKLRVDNADFLELARSIDAWQAEIDAGYRLKAYPLEAQLAWAARIRQDLGGSLNASRERGSKKNLEDYYWVSTSVETLRKLKAVAIREGLADADLTICCERLEEEGVKARQRVVFAPDYYEQQSQGETDPGEPQMKNEMAAYAKELQDSADVVGHYRGKPVTAFGIHHSETQLSQIEKHGFFVGTCGAHTHLTTDMMRSLGIASHRFRVVRSREGTGDHAWPARYDPSRNVWLAYQPLQQKQRDKVWHYFFIDRRPVFSYASEAREFRMSRNNRCPRPFPLVFCRELQGPEVGKLSHTGIPTKEVREWMLTPSF